MTKRLTRSKHSTVYADNETTIGNRFRYVRLCRGLSQEAIAQKCGYDQAHLSRLENDKTIFLGWLAKLADALDCSLRITLVPKPDRPLQLDFRLLMRDGRIARRPTVKVRDEFRALVAWSERQFPKVGHQRRYLARKRATSDRKRIYGEVRAAREKLRREQLAQPTPLPDILRVP